LGLWSFFASWWEGGLPITTIKLLVADDHTIRRQSLVCLLRTQSEFEVIGESSEGYELLEMPGNLSPDIVLTELDLPTINKIDPIKLILQWNPAQRILVITDNISPSRAIKALRHGARGYFVTMDDFDHLIQAIISVHQGRRYVSSLVTDQILDVVISGKNFEKEIDERISSREREILQLIAEGKTNSEIGKLLSISTRTVETHRTNLMRKLGISSQIDIIRYAFKHGLLSVE
jgi:two-component system response regulator NreC